MSEIEGSMNDLARALERLPTPEERRAEAEQRAWDGAYDSVLASLVADGNYFSPEDVGGKEPQARVAAAYADAKLAERRKRFGAGKEAHPGLGKVAVPRELLLKCISGLRGGVPEYTRHLFADDLRALVSE